MKQYPQRGVSSEGPSHRLLRHSEAEDGEADRSPRNRWRGENHFLTKTSTNTHRFFLRPTRTVSQSWRRTGFTESKGIKSSTAPSSHYLISRCYTRPADCEATIDSGLQALQECQIFNNPRFAAQCSITCKNNLEPAVHQILRIHPIFLSVPSLLFVFIF